MPLAGTPGVQSATRSRARRDLSRSAGAGGRSAAAADGTPLTGVTQLGVGLGVRRSRDTVVTMATLEIPQEVLSVLGADPARAAGELRLLAAMKLFELGRLSSGAAASLAGIARVEFLAKLGAYGVSPFQVSPEALEQDLENARHAIRRS
jgi:predicted HTH domain antitoxin